MSSRPWLAHEHVAALIKLPLLMPPGSSFVLLVLHCVVLNNGAWLHAMQSASSICVDAADADGTSESPSQEPKSA